MKTKLNLKVTLEDIGRARCGNRRRCVLAQALDRQLKLGGRGYIKVDANGARFTRNRLRHLYYLPNKALTYLRRFDEIGEVKGEMAARAAIKPQAFALHLINVKAIPPGASRKRKDQINKARNKARAIERAEGILPKVYARYTGITPLPPA